MKQTSPARLANNPEAEPASHFYNLKSPQRSWRDPRDKPVWESPREINLCPEKQHLPLRAALAAPRSHNVVAGWDGHRAARLVSRHQGAWPERTANSAALLQLPVLHSSTMTWAGRTLAPGQREVFLLPSLSFSTCRERWEKIWSEPCRSLFWKGKRGSCNVWVGVLQRDPSVLTSPSLPRGGTGWPSL